MQTNKGWRSSRRRCSSRRDGTLLRFTRASRRWQSSRRQCCGPRECLSTSRMEASASTAHVPSQERCNQSTRVRPQSCPSAFLLITQSLLPRPYPHHLLSSLPHFPSRILRPLPSGPLTRSLSPSGNSPIPCISSMSPSLHLYQSLTPVC